MRILGRTLLVLCLATLAVGCGGYRREGAYSKVHIESPWYGWAPAYSTPASFVGEPGGDPLPGGRPSPPPAAAPLPEMGMPDYGGGFDDGLDGNLDY